MAFIVFLVKAFEYNIKGWLSCACPIDKLWMNAVCL